MMRTTISKQPESPPALVRTPAGGGLRIDRKCDACAEEDQEIQRAVDPGVAPVTGHQFARLSVLAPSPTAPAESLAVSEPSDPSEQVAEHVAEQVMRRLSAGAPRGEGPAISTAARPVVQRAAEQGPETETTAAQGGFLVDDETGSLLPGQMRKSEFLRVLRPAVCTAADRELARAGRNTDGCPYLDRWFAYYAGRDARQVEHSLRKYAPETARATSASDYIGPISERVARGVHRWVDTGEVPELPEGVSTDMLGGGDVLGTLAEVGSAIGGAISSGLSAIGSLFSGLFFKASEGGAARGADRGALDARLGEGRPLDSASRSRMGAAFGYDFTAVRVHDDAPAAELARGLNARAFTLGTHVAFGANEYRPGQPVGDALLAHELAHVVQQRGTSGRLVGELAASETHALEADADQAATTAVGALWRGTRTSARPAVRARGVQLARCGAAQRPAAMAPLEMSAMRRPAGYGRKLEAAVQNLAAPDRDEVAHNTARNLAAGHPPVYFTSELELYEGTDRWRNPVNGTQLYTGPRNNSGRGFTNFDHQTHRPTAIFLNEFWYSRDTPQGADLSDMADFEETLTHEMNHAVNPDPDLLEVFDSVGHYKSEFNAYWVTPRFSAMPTGQRAAAIKTWIVGSRPRPSSGQWDGNYPSIAQAYWNVDSDRAQMDAYTRPDSSANLTNAWPSLPAPFRPG